MKTHMFSGLGFGLLIAITAPACLVSGTGHMTVETGATVDVVQEPPAPRVEVVTVKSGFVWVKGRWNWSGNQWVWMSGRWERERANQMWTEGRWEKRGTQWHWIEGTWAVGGGGGVEVRDHRDPPQGGVEVRDHRDPVPPPHAEGGVSVNVSVQPAPPEIRVEAHEGRAGFIWMPGHWQWVGGKYEWMTGRWERERANKHFIEGKWELRGNAWIWTEGNWEDAPSGPTVRDHRH